MHGMGIEAPRYVKLQIVKCEDADPLPPHPISLPHFPSYFPSCDPIFPRDRIPFTNTTLMCDGNSFSGRLEPIELSSITNQLELITYSVIPSKFSCSNVPLLGTRILPRLPNSDSAWLYPCHPEFPFSRSRRGFQ